ncbi:HD domain-containing protein [Corallibacter sp.]|uniref:HD domain-containing protein n=1 Tax=Corallibacter sp. TaxID=2038084 RepID=UPI003A94204F
MNHSEIILKTVAFVKQTLKDAEGGHDWFHIERVYKNALLIANHENVDTLVVQFGALLHDIADSKFHNGDESIGPKIASEFLENLNVDTATIQHVIKIIENISYSSSLDINKTFRSPELDVVQDADRLDALGAIGIARAFNYGGFKDRALYNPEIAPNLNMSKAEYKSSTAPTINHFYEKLLLLKDKMNTKTGKKLAEKRHTFMLQYLEHFYAEWEGKQ